MAYMVELGVVVCQEDRCGRTPTHQVLDRRNEQVGKFCKKHAEAMVDTINGWEATTWTEPLASMSGEQPCPTCDGKGYWFDHPEVDDPDDWSWCETCNVTGVQVADAIAGSYRPGTTTNREA